MTASAPHAASAAAILTLCDDHVLCADIERVVAAAGLTMIRADDPPTRRAWTSAAAVLLDDAAAARCAPRRLARRSRVLLVSAVAPGPTHWQAAVAVGAQQVLQLPAQDGDLMAVLAEAADSVRDAATRGPVVAVLAGRGGAGASIFATALARVAAESLLVEADPLGSGLDLLLGSETEPGLRWTDLSLTGGRLSYPALRDALPRRHEVSVLAVSRMFGADRAGNVITANITAAALESVIDAGSRAGVPVVCDVARQANAVSDVALALADLVVLLTVADVRSSASAAATARWVAAANPNTGLVIRGPAPGGLRPAEVGRIVGLPVLAAMRPEPGLDPALEHGGLRLRRRSPMAAAARAVLDVLRANPHLESPVEAAA
ncbi:septum site-determining protein Ssd [Mycobacterium sp. SMC-4]|uniref:septum site-determining protein Ssd n=1 Tax=Mycobacterium sp. SMC-4 TaxID=2857059 RepID=UPI0021B38C38|nr:septum site-determining protein Ssd [Mycobacterium sp. SMC-4]UXA17680.1 AAA family ATPase [Mycobacterium sp. SMC-4]